MTSPYVTVMPGCSKERMGQAMEKYSTSMQTQGIVQCYINVLTSLHFVLLGRFYLSA